MRFVNIVIDYETYHKNKIHYGGVNIGKTKEKEIINL
jgi:hypothetical protein